MRQEEVSPGRTDQEYVELWFSLPEDQRLLFANAYKQFESELANASNPVTMNSKWDFENELWFHDIPPIRFAYTARQDGETGEWAAVIDSFYWFQKT